MYPLLQVHWDRYNQQSHITLNYLMKGHHLYRGLWIETTKFRLEVMLTVCVFCLKTIFQTKHQASLKHFQPVLCENR